MLAQAYTKTFECRRGVRAATAMQQHVSLPDRQSAIGATAIVGGPLAGAVQ